MREKAGEERERETQILNAYDSIGFVGISIVSNCFVFVFVLRFAGAQLFAMTNKHFFFHSLKK